MYIAHTENRVKIVHGLAEHLYAVADIMSKFVCNSDYSWLFAITGLLHDLGKYQSEFQDYLKNGGRRGSVPHAVLGAVYAYMKLRQTEAAFAIDGHHKGLPDLGDLSQDIKLAMLEKNKLDEIFEIFEQDVTFNNTLIPEKPIFKDSYKRELLTRYLFSSLTDADWLDTEAHFSHENKIERISVSLDHDKLIKAIDRLIASKRSVGKINEMRTRARQYAISKAEMPQGFYSLTLPTGMGKTLTSVTWALHHAKRHKLERLIIVLPFTSIIDQTAKELKLIFGDGLVLEHHTNYNENLDVFQEKEEASVDAYRHRLATENWDYPIIITTTVQFFESLFSNMPSKCRKIHNIARSVVVFDEVQTLPKELVIPTLTMLKNVQEVMNVSLLFCTATQPAFAKRHSFDGIENIEPLVENSAQLFEATRRVDYRALNGFNEVTNELILDSIIQDGNSALCIFNTKQKAKNFYECIIKAENFLHFHLSTNMCPAHRKEVIEKIRLKLAEREKILLSSTQLIEAGVDFDFPAVYREISPLESIIQSAGRCNREGKMDKPGQVYIFKHEDSKTPDRQYASLAEYALDTYKTDLEKLHKHDFFTEYYADSHSLFFEPDKKGINQDREKFRFRTVAGTYHLIDSDTEAVFIYKFDDKSEALYLQLKDKEQLSRADYRLMQPYNVQLYKNAMIANHNQIGREKNGMVVWFGGYSKEYGIQIEQKNETLIY